MIVVFTELNVPEIFNYYHVFYSCRMKSTEIHSSLVSPTLITVTEETYYIVFLKKKSSESGDTYSSQSNMAF